jgi:chromosomal replication initiation ATPase DnaA
MGTMLAKIVFKGCIRLQAYSYFSFGEELVPRNEAKQPQQSRPSRRGNEVAIGNDQFRSWFRDLSIVSEQEDVVTLGLPSKFYCNEVEKRFGHKLLRWCQAVYPGKQLVRIVDLSERS